MARVQDVSFLGWRHSHYGTVEEVWVGIVNSESTKRMDPAAPWWVKHHNSANIENAVPGARHFKTLKAARAHIAEAKKNPSIYIGKDGVPDGGFKPARKDGHEISSKCFDSNFRQICGVVHNL